MFTLKESFVQHGVALAFCLVFAANSCALFRDHPLGPQSTTFSGQVGPALAASCNPACHGSGSGNGDWTDSTEVCANLSDMIRRINNGTMPPGGGLDPAVKASLVKCLQDWQQVCK